MMTWKKTDAESERAKFVEDYFTGRYSVVELTQLYGVSERTGHKTLKRYKTEGPAGLVDRSRARHTQDATPEHLVAAIIELRRAHPRWGAKKLRAVLEREHPDERWPAPSTVHCIIDRYGLVEAKRRRRNARPPDVRAPCVEAVAPNYSWSIDFKGQFRTGDRRLVYPLTVTDNASRLILCCQGLLHPTTDDTWRELVVCFREYGLPVAIRSDNGAPFAGNGLTRQSVLSVRLMKLGILPDFIRRGAPYQNGRHERMHRTLKEETASPPAGNLREQQRRFNKFITEFNELRPHEALGNKVPAEIHTYSVRQMPHRLPDVDYDAGAITRSVRHNGCFKWKENEHYLGEPFRGERVAFDQVADGIYQVRFASYVVAVFEEKKERLRHAGWKPIDENVN
jgi:putative transposase